MDADPKESDFRCGVLLSVQRVLLGEITPEMRAIEVEISPALILIRVYTDGEASRDVQEDFDAGAVTQVIADFAWPERGDPRVELEFVRFVAPRRIPARGIRVFAREEAKRYATL